MPTVFATLTALLQKVHKAEGAISAEAFLDVCRQIIPVTGQFSDVHRR